MSKRIGWMVRTIVVILLFALILSWVTMVLLPDKGRYIIGFYEEPEESLDVLFVGSSPLLWGVSPLVLWNEFGMASFSRANGLQPPFATYYYLMEALETQSPKVVVLYMPKLFQDYNVDTLETRVRSAIDYTPPSRYKLAMILEAVKRSETQTVWSYLFPLLRYHDRWKDSDIGWKDFNIREKFGRNQHVYRGQSPHFKVKAYEDFDFSMWDESVEAKEASAYSEEYLAKIVELLKKEGIPLVIMDMPRVDPEYGRHLAFLELAEKYQVDVLDLAAPEIMEAMEIDPQEDFYDATHSSTFGSEKISRYLGSYLKEHYDIPDRRGESGMERWDTDYEVWESEVEKLRDELATGGLEADGETAEAVAGSEAESE